MPRSNQQALGAFADAGDHLAQARLHVAEGAQQLAHLIAAAGVDLRAQPPLGNTLAACTAPARRWRMEADRVQAMTTEAAMAISPPSTRLVRAKCSAPARFSLR